MIEKLIKHGGSIFNIDKMKASGIVGVFEVFHVLDN